MGKRRKKRNKYLKDASGRFQGSAPLPVSPPPTAMTVETEAGQPVLPASAENSPHENVASMYALFASPRFEDSLPTEVRDLVARISRDIGANEGEIYAALRDWKNADARDFEDYPAPRHEYRYDLLPEAAGSPGLQRALRKLGYEHFLRQPHPCFVYGTLRRGQGNSVLLDRARERTVMAELTGVSLFTKHWGFPYALEDSDSAAAVTGEIVWLEDSANGDEARVSLDYLEGFDSDFPSQSHYERAERIVTYWDEGEKESKTTRVWVYLARGAAARSLRPEDRLLTGDWVLEKAFNRVG